MSARTKRTWPQRVRTVGAAILAGVAMMAVTSARSGAATAPTQFVSLEGEGTWSIWQNVVAWQNDLVSAPKYVNFNYTKHGSLLGRASLINGSADFAISGVGFSADELKGVKGGAEGLISAPIQVATLGNFVEPLYVNGGNAGYPVSRQICDPDADPETWPPGITDFSQCISKAEYTGPIRIPNASLAAMYAQYRVGSPYPSSWNSPETLQALDLAPRNDAGVGDAFDTASPNTGPGVAGRSDPDEINKYLSMFLKFANPAAAASIGITEPSERVRALGVTSDGAEQQLAQLAQNGCGVGTGLPCGVNISPSGGIAYAPPSGMLSFKNAYPGLRLDLAQMQNANGDWIAPTPDSINKAVDAGGSTPLYALDHKVEGAYPLVWVDRLYAPAHGLSPQKTEGLAMLMRYLATTGQENEAKVGEGRLTPEMVTETLAAANKLVESNCVGDDRKLVVDHDLGPLAPPDATAMQSITGDIDHCVGVGRSATTTTTTLPVAPAGSGGGGGSNFPSSSDTGNTGSVDNSSATSNQNGSNNNASNTSNNPPDVVNPATVDVIGKVKVKNTSVLLTATNLPMPAPTGHSGADRLGAFLLGVFLFLLLRKPVQRLFTKSVV